MMGDIKEKLVEGVAESAKKQILGQSEKEGGEYFKEMMGDLKTMPPEKLEEARQKEASQVRARLQEINAAIQRVRIQKGQEIPKYISGKPGEAKTQEEKIDLWQKEQKEAEKRKKEESLAASVTQLFGSHEKGKIVGE